MSEKTLDEQCADMLENHDGALGKSFAAPPEAKEPGGHVGDVMRAMRGGWTEAQPAGTHDVYLDGTGNVEVALPEEPVQKSEDVRETSDGTMIVFGSDGQEPTLEKSGPVAVGKRGGKIYGYDSKGNPIYNPGDVQPKAGKELKPTGSPSAKTVATNKEQVKNAKAGDVFYATNTDGTKVTYDKLKDDGPYGQGMWQVTVMNGPNKGDTADVTDELMGYRMSHTAVMMPRAEGPGGTKPAFRSDRDADEFKPKEPKKEEPKTKLSDESEFQRRRNMPGVEVKYMHAGRGGNVQDIQLHLMGQMIGWKTNIGSGKKQQTSFHLPEMKKSMPESLDALEEFAKSGQIKGTPIGSMTPSRKYVRTGKEEYTPIDEYKMQVEGKGHKDTAEKIKGGIKESADICKISPPICHGNLGIPRKDMPQLPGSVIPKFLEHMREKGAKVDKNERMKVGELKATQKEINADKVQGMADSYRKGTFPNIKDAIIVSSDGYILDGHHRWAALLTESPGETMNVHKVDAPIKQILDEANKFEGVSQQGFGDPSSMKKSEKLYPLGEALAKGIAAMKKCDMSKCSSMSKCDCEKCDQKSMCPQSTLMKKSSLDGLTAMSEYLGRDIDKEQDMSKSDGQPEGDLGAKTPGLAAMADFAKSDGGLPTSDHKSLKKPKSQKQGESADGGSLEATGKTSDAGAPAAPGPGQNADGQVTGTSAGTNQKLSDDDADVNGQMKPHTKPIEKTTKSMTTAQGQRDQVAHEHAVAASRLRKAQDERLFSQQLSDQVSADMVKSDTFYVGGEEPQLQRQERPLEGIVMCKSETCDSHYSAMLTACPKCGEGQVQHRVAPGEYLGKSEVRGYNPVLKKAREPEDVIVGERVPIKVVRQ